jgi:hypothetical protein
MVRREDDIDRKITHELRHAADLTPDARQKEILRHAIGHDLLRLPIGGFEAINTRTGREENIFYNPEHPLERENGVEFIYVTDEAGIAELIILPKRSTVTITGITFSYNMEDGLKDFDLVPEPFQRDPTPTPHDFSHYLYKVNKGRANVDPLFRFIRVIVKNENISAFMASQQEEHQAEVRRTLRRQRQEYDPSPPVIQSRYVPREARSPETVASVSG